MSPALRNLLRHLADERGLETVEWSIVAAVIVVGLAALTAAIGATVSSHFSAVQGEVP